MRRLREGLLSKKLPFGTLLFVGTLPYVIVRSQSMSWWVWVVKVLVWFLPFVPQNIEIFPKYIQLQLVLDILVLFWMLVFYFKHRNENIPQSTITTITTIISPHILMWPIIYFLLISFCSACSHLLQLPTSLWHFFCSAFFFGSSFQFPQMWWSSGMDIFPQVTSHIFNQTQVRALCRPFSCTHLGSCVPRETNALVCCHVGRWGDTSDPVLLLSAWLFSQNLKLFLFIHDSFPLTRIPISDHRHSIQQYSH